MDDLVKGLIHEGGGYLLAAVGFYLLYKMDQLRVADLKAIHARESSITATLIEIVTENTAAITALGDEIAMLRTGSSAVRDRRGRQRIVQDVKRTTAVVKDHPLDETWSKVGGES